MSLLKKISPNGMLLHRMYYPQGNYRIDFELDDESHYLLGDVCRDLSDEVNLKIGIERAAYHLVFTMLYKEFEKIQNSEVMNVVADPTNNSRLFSIGLKRGEENNHFVITKAKIIVKELPRKSLIAGRLESSNLKIKRGEDAPSVIIIFSIDEESRSHLDAVEFMCENDNEASAIKNNIRRAIAEWVYENMDDLSQGYTYEKKLLGVLDDEDEYKFLFTVRNLREIIVNKIEVCKRDPYKFE